jgi:hypothetical protein
MSWLQACFHHKGGASEANDHQPDKLHSVRLGTQRDRRVNDPADLRVDLRRFHLPRNPDLEFFQIHECVGELSGFCGGGVDASRLIVGAPFIRDGYIQLSDWPGLGCELNEECARGYLRPESGLFE